VFRAGFCEQDRPDVEELTGQRVKAVCDCSFKRKHRWWDCVMHSVCVCVIIHLTGATQPETPEHDGTSVHITLKQGFTNWGLTVGCSWVDDKNKALTKKLLNLKNVFSHHISVVIITGSNFDH